VPHPELPSRRKCNRWPAELPRFLFLEKNGDSAIDDEFVGGKVHASSKKRARKEVDEVNLRDTSSITMKSTTVAGLRNQFAAVSKWIHDGESVVITKRGRPFATLAPVRKRKALPPLDRLARLQRIFPNGPVDGDSSDVVDYDRGDR
jgi:prevent-host-death family protein